MGNFHSKIHKRLLAAFPQGADTPCKHSVETTTGETGKLLKPCDFPFKNAEDVNIN